MTLAFEFAERNNVNHTFNKITKLAGKNWIAGFCNRNNLRLCSAEKCSLGRAVGFNKVQSHRFFENLKTVLEDKKFPPHRIFNMDESGLSTVSNNTPKVILRKGKRHVGKVVSADRGQNVTVVCSMSPTGIYVPPAIIFPRKRMNDDLYRDAPEGSLPLISDTGYMNTELFIDWLNHFSKHVKPCEEDPVLLILDNHISHCSLDAVMLCRNSFITLLSLPPHASHIMQPLDKGFFGPLKNSFSIEYDNWMVSNPGRAITQREISSLFRPSYEKVSTIEKARNSFRGTGIHPFNSEIFSDEDFEPSAVTDRINTAEQDDDNRVQESNRTDMESQPAESSKRNKESQPVSLSSLLTLPIATFGQKAKRRGKKSEIMTSSPFKIKLIESSKGKVMRKQVKHCDLEVPSTSIINQDIHCPGCYEPYREPINEDWVQCTNCLLWWHEVCSCYEGAGIFKCNAY